MEGTAPIRHCEGGGSPTRQSSFVIFSSVTLPIETNEENGINDIERGETMAVLKEGGIPIGRFMIVNKTEGLTRDDLVIESNGQYQIMEKPDAFLIKNAECCKSIMVKVTKKD